MQKVVVRLQLFCFEKNFISLWYDSPTMKKENVTNEELAGMVQKGFQSVHEELSKKADKADVVELRSDVSGLKSDVSGLKSDVTDLKHKTERIDRRLENWQDASIERFQKIEADVDILKEKTA